MTSRRSMRSLVLAVTIGSFSVAALMGVVALLGGGSFGESEGRILLTTLVFGCASVAVLCYLATAGTPYQPVGLAGGVVVLLPLLSSLWLIWTSWDDAHGEGWLKALGVGVVLAATLAQACLLLVVAGPVRRLGVLLATTLVLAALVAALLSTIIVGAAGADGTWRLLGVLSILDVLATVVALALATFGSAAQHRNASVRRATATVALPAETVARLDERALRSGRSRDSLVAEAVDRYLATPVREESWSERH